MTRSHFSHFFGTCKSIPQLVRYRSIRLVGAVGLVLILLAQSPLMAERIQPYENNPYYWQYKGEPVLLLGGSWQDNLFNHPANLEEHLDILAEAGGNYVRNTMTSRNEGNVWAFAKTEGGLYDLDRWNEEYWDRLVAFLEKTHEREIIVQVEVWDRWDYFAHHQSQGGWAFNPFNPENNINYTAEESGLPTEIDYNPGRHPTNHSFFQTVPDKEDLPVAREYQEKFVDRILSVTLEYPHVLYCISNETSERAPWSDYWAKYIHEKADEAGRAVYLTEMPREGTPDAPAQRRIYGEGGMYNYIEISQNAKTGQAHWEMMQETRDALSDDPRPINNVKIYGGGHPDYAWAGTQAEAAQRMWGIIFGGGAAGRFHRPHPIESPEEHLAVYGAGIGLSPFAQAQIKSGRMLSEALDLFACEPRNDLLSNRSEGEAYCLAEPGEQYAVYFPGEGDVDLDLSEADTEFEVRWLDIAQSEWGEREQVEGGGRVHLSTPDDAAWAVLLMPVD